MTHVITSCEDKNNGECRHDIRGYVAPVDLLSAVFEFSSFFVFDSFPSFAFDSSPSPVFPSLSSASLTFARNWIPHLFQLE